MKAPLLRQHATVLKKSDLAALWPLQWTSAGACQNGTDEQAEQAEAHQHAGFEARVGEARRRRRLGVVVREPCASISASSAPPSTRSLSHRMTQVAAA